MQPVDRDMTAEFRQGCVDSSYIQLAPNVGGLVETAWRIDRAVNQLPNQFASAEVRGLDPFDTARMHRTARPVEPYSRYLPTRVTVGHAPEAPVRRPTPVRV